VRLPITTASLSGTVELPSTAEERAPRYLRKTHRRINSAFRSKGMVRSAARGDVFVEARAKEPFEDRREQAFASKNCENSPARESWKRPNYVLTD